MSDVEKYSALLEKEFPNENYKVLPENDIRSYKPQTRAEAVSYTHLDVYKRQDRKMAEYAQAVCHGRPCFHISLVQDISPNCDCHGENDEMCIRDSTNREDWEMQ